MHVFIYGTNKVPVGVDEYFLKCPSCESLTLHDVMISSVYMHFFWIPVWPADKLADTVCTKCGLKRYERGFDSNLIPDFDTVKSKYKHPFYTYVIPLFIGALIVTGVVLSFSS